MSKLGNEGTIGSEGGKGKNERWLGTREGRLMQGRRTAYGSRGEVHASPTI